MVQRIQIDPTNYGLRIPKDVNNEPLETVPTLIVLHETVYGINSVLSTLKTRNVNDYDQVSYHFLVGENGELIETVPTMKRAFGAGNSSFNGYSDKTNPALDPSVNNFALHVALETPIDGEDDEKTHSGYTSKQYDSLAILLSNWMQKYQIPFERVTTHNFVDNSGERLCPRSFDWRHLQSRLAELGALC